MYFKEKILLAIIFMMLFLCCFTGKIVAQDLSIGVSASFDYNAYWFVEEENHIKYKGAPGFSVGLTMQGAVNTKLLLKSGLFYSVKNLVEINSIDYNDPNIIDGPYESTYSTKFIDVPLDFSILVKSKEKLRIYFLSGIINSFRVGYSSEKALFRQEKMYSQYILSVKGGTSILLNMKKCKLILDPQLRYYLTRINESGTRKNPIYLGIEISYHIPLGKKE